MNPFVSVHLESGEKAVIVEGTAKEIRPTRQLAVDVAQAYSAKYAAAGYSPEPSSWDSGGLFEVTPHAVIAWTSFAEDPTKFAFPIESDYSGCRVALRGMGRELSPQIAQISQIKNQICEICGSPFPANRT